MTKFIAASLAAFFLFIPHAQAASCGSSDFGEFFETFLTDVAFQKSSVAAPMKNVYLKPALPLPEPVEQNLGVDQIKFPVIPTREEIEKQGGHLAIYEHNDEEKEVHIVGKDTNSLVAYVFNFKDGCWRLSKKDDQSFEVKN